MRNLYATAAVLVLAATAALALTGIAGADNKGSTKVKLLSESFSPDKKSISKGTTVKFKWVDGKHDVIKASGPGGDFDSGVFNTPGVHFEHKFSKAGTYKIFCTIHDGMKLKLNVG